MPVLPLLPQYSAAGAGVPAFAFDYTNDNEKAVDTSLYRTAVHMIFDGQDYGTHPTTLTGDYMLDPGKTRAFSLSMADFTVTKDTDVWPLKPGRHTVLFKFGGKQFGPLTFDWRAGGAVN
jgi:hypothetical protein